MKYKLLILVSVLLVLTFSEAEALRGDTQEIIYNHNHFNYTITVDPYLLTESRNQSINEVLFSDEVLSIPDILLHKGPKGINTDYYLGWELALNQVQPTKLNLKITDRPGDIHIHLFNSKNDKSGLTFPFNEKSMITIYDVDNWTPNSFKTILRHELGHAFGLGHTTADEELMYPIINQYYPYISSCNIMALSQNNNTEIRCEK